MTKFKDLANTFFKKGLHNSPIKADVFNPERLSPEITACYNEKVVRPKYVSPLLARNLKLDLKDETVESLFRVCRKKVPEFFGRYYKVKTKWLDHSPLMLLKIVARSIDQYNKKTYTFNEAIKEVEQAFRAFDPEFAELALKVYTSKRLSARCSPNIQEAGFCVATVPIDTPWVIITFKKGQYDLFTLAHELGHAAHFLMSSKLSFFEFNSSPPIAETASFFGEMLLAKRLREKSDEKDIKAINLILLDKAYLYIGWYAFMTLFEVEAHRMISQVATPNELSEAFLKNLNEQFGDTGLVHYDWRWDWLKDYFTFFEKPFFSYVYTFGQLLAFNLWKIYETEGASFVPKFKAILAKGGSASPEEILRGAGFGPLDDDFWSRGFDFLDSLIPKE
jgi:oligoendopeptidase F